MHLQLQYITLHYNCNYHLIALHNNYNYIYNYTTLGYNTLDYNTLCHNATLQCTTLHITPHHNYNSNCNYTTLITRHYNYNLQLQLHLQLQLQLQLHYTTLHPAVVVRWPLPLLQPLPKTQLQPPFGSVHQWIRSAIRESQQPALPIGFLFLKLPPSPCAVLLIKFKERPNGVGKYVQDICRGQRWCAPPWQIGFRCGLLHFLGL